MAYVASWHAPQGDVVGSKNMEAVPHNDDNYNQLLVQNDTVGYYKPPFCQWPFGGYSKKEAKYRRNQGEPVVKAGSYEKDGNEFYFHTRGTKFEHPKDEDNVSVATASTTLYLNSNLCTRTFGPHKKASKFPDGANFVRPKFDMNRDRMVCDFYPGMMERHNQNKTDIWKMNASGLTGTRGRTMSDTIFMTEKAQRIRQKGVDERSIKPTDPKGLEQKLEEEEENQTRGRSMSHGRLTMANRLSNPRNYSCGTVPRLEARFPQNEIPTWRKDFLEQRLAREATRRLASPSRYLNKDEHAAAKQARLRREAAQEDAAYEPNEESI